MGALTSNRKRPDESSSLLQSPSSCFYNNQIDDTHLSKKPKISSVISTPEKLNLSSSPQNIVSRLQRYPKPTRKLPREVHAPIRVTRFGFLSSSSGTLKSRVSDIKERDNDMGNALIRFYEKTKKLAFQTFQHVKVIEEDAVYEEPQSKEDVMVSEDSSDVHIMEDGNEVRSVVSNDYRAREDDGLVPESRNLRKEALKNCVTPASPSAMSDLSKLEETKKMYGPFLGREAYKNLLGTVERTYSGLKTLEFDIESVEAGLRSIRSLHSWKRELDEQKKPEEPIKPEKDTLHELFLPLTEEEEKEVKQAFSNASRRKVLVTHKNSNIEITGLALQCLRPGAWLNDEVINIYLELLKERERREPKKFLNCHFFSTFFYKKLIGKDRDGYDYKSVRRWTTQRKLGYGLIDCDKIFVPIHKEVHWCLAVINKLEKKFQYLDSLGGRDRYVLNVLAKYFVDEVKDKSGQDIDVSAWECEYVDDLPEQQNGYDCGVFMVKYADFYSRDMGLRFSQEHMPYFRQRTAKEILKLRAD